ncbi:MAG: tyrosine--tRNA ligase [Candidatus Woesearchaeota archaeon]|jgi:tyrosyl-tRNA synthetase
MHQKKINLVKEVGEEVLTDEELKKLFDTKEHPIAYDGFEPSGTNIHIAQGLLRAININKMTAAGCKFKMLIADWHAWANNKMSGDLDKIQKVGEFYKHVWEACDMDVKNVEFVWASDLVKDNNYWKIVMSVARNSSMNRILRTVEIMGRSEKDSLSAAQILYPCMQAADIFYLKADICQLGLDQRKVNVLAREVAEKLGYEKPIVVSHHMLMGLGEPPKEELTGAERGIALKMSKSKPDTAIFMLDTKEEIERKIKKAYCPEKKIEENPMLEYCKYIIYEKFSEIHIKRPEKFGGDLTIKSYQELETLFKEGKLHPMDLKTAVTEYLNKLMEPIRIKLHEDKKAMKLYEEIQKFQVTR